MATVTTGMALAHGANYDLVFLFTTNQFGGRWYDELRAVADSDLCCDISNCRVAESLVLSVGAEAVGAGPAG